MFLYLWLLHTLSLSCYSRITLLYTFSWSYPCNIHFPSTLMFAHIISHIWFRVFTTTPLNIFTVNCGAICVMVGWTQEFIAFTKETPHLSDFWRSHCALWVWLLPFNWPTPAPAPAVLGSTCLCSDSSASYLLYGLASLLFFCPWRKIWVSFPIFLLFSMCLLIPYPQCEFVVS